MRKTLFGLLFISSSVFASQLKLPTHGEISERNIDQSDLTICNTMPTTGFYRTGYCETDVRDKSRHSICATMTPEFLEFSRSHGNDLQKKRPGFDGLYEGDNWCICESRYLEAQRAGVAPPILRHATHASAQRVVDTKIEQSFKVNRVDSQTYVLTDLEYFHSNILVTIHPDKNILITSSPFEEQKSRVLVDWIKINWPEHHITAINDHFHFDGTGGNAVFHDMRVSTWASLRTVKNQMQDRNEGLKILKPRLKPALLKRLTQTRNQHAQNIFTEDKHTFHFGKEEVQVIFAGEAHTKDNVVIYFPQRDILFGGCIVHHHGLGNVRDANLAEWRNTLHNIEQLPFSKLIPGHGPISGKDLVQKTNDFVLKHNQHEL